MRQGLDIGGNFQGLPAQRGDGSVKLGRRIGRLLQLLQRDRQQRQPLTDVVVQIPRDAGPLGFLRLEQAAALVREDFFRVLARRDVLDGAAKPGDATCRPRPTSPRAVTHGAHRC